MRFRLHPNAGVNVAEELFHRRFTVAEDFESKNAVIEVHLTSIDMLVSVTVNSVNRKISSFTTAYLPGKTFTNEVSIEQIKVEKCNIKRKANGASVSQRKRRLSTKLQSSLDRILAIVPIQI